MIKKPFNEKEAFERLRSFWIGNPITSHIFVVLVIAFIGGMVYTIISPRSLQPLPPQYTIGETFDYALNDFKMPLILWAVLTLFLWLTKW